ncbi:hypothetical protein BDL97_03G118400 [Sphagnum fallax]|nr:hypothetical protein BDL97_03G118400 [Sphagnum fallax]
MESRTSAAITTQVVQKLPAAVITTPTNEDLFGSGGKKKKVGLARTRKALADKTNDSETSSGLMTPMTLVKEEGGGEQMSCCYYRSTPYSKVHDDLHKQEAAALPEEQVLYTQVCTLLHNKVEAEEYRLHRMPSEFRTPGELAAPTPANTPINVVPSTFSHSVLVMDKADVSPLELQLLYKFGKAATLSPSAEQEEDTSCMTKPLEDALDNSNYLEECLEKVMWKSEKNLSSSRESDMITVATKPSGWVGRGEEVRKCMTGDDHEDDDDASSECSVVVNVSSPHMQEKCESPSKFSIADNRINSSSPLQQHKDNSSENVKSDEREKGYVDYEYYYYYGEEEEDDEANEEYEDVELDGECNELCNAINQFTMNEKEESVGLPVSTGQHVRFSYNSDDEMEAEVVDAESCCPDSATVLHLKGLPTPKGKHLRFTEDIGTSV